ncbi:MAG: hypothetical protein JWM55_220 [Acidimicrobiaceae bacterium]|nr:hypothetical protein [Acidimicrobiaceae bacterium]
MTTIKAVAAGALIVVTLPLMLAFITIDRYIERNSRPTYSTRS